VPNETLPASARLRQGSPLPYANTVTLTSLEGGTWPPVTARLWMLVTLPPPLGTNQTDRGSDSVTSASSFPFSFSLGPSFPGAGIGISLQDTPRVANDSGWWFRSGQLSGALPTDPIEVVLLAPVGLTRADFAAALPTLPIAMSSSRAITFLSVISGSFLVVTAAGTTTEALGVPVAFTCRIEFDLSASSSISAPSELIKLGSVNSVIVSFSGTNPAAATAAAILDVEPGLKQQYQDFVTNTILPVFARGLGARLVNAVLSTSLAGLIGPGVTALPAGVILSVLEVPCSAQHRTMLHRRRSHLRVFTGGPGAPRLPRHLSPLKPYRNASSAALRSDLPAARKAHSRKSAVARGDQISGRKTCRVNCSARQEVVRRRTIVKQIWRTFVGGMRLTSGGLLGTDITRTAR
jgi:hypothetical protein